MREYSEEPESLYSNLSGQGKDVFNHFNQTGRIVPYAPGDQPEIVVRDDDL
jgi:hypothetical protein